MSTEHEAMLARAALLTPRERDVMQAATEGGSYKAIARKLGISEFTVNDHTKAIYRKLRAKSMAHAVALLMRAGVIS